MKGIMKIGPNTNVTLEYTLFLESGELIDSSKPGRPLVFTYGGSQIIPGLERQLDGLEAGDEKEVRVSPDEGYGDIDPDKIRAVDMGHFPPGVELEVGKSFYLQREGEDILPFTVKEIKEGSVTVDFNHPLAAKTLHFKILVKNVTEASSEKLET